MDRIEAKLKEMGYSLPPPWPFASPNRQGCVRVGNILFLSGHAPHHPDLKVKDRGKVGLDVTQQEAYEAARAAGLTMLATVKQEIGTLDKVKHVIRLFGMVHCTPEFQLAPKVIDGCSDLFYELFGPQVGRHARSAVGMVSLSSGLTVEINGEFEVAD